MIFLFKNSYEYFYREALLAICKKKNQTKENQLIQGSFIKNNFSETIKDGSQYLC